MNPIARLFHPLRQAAAAFFKHDIALRRADGAVHIVLEQRGAKNGKAKVLTREEQAARKEKDELALMRSQLRELLDQVPETRPALRHLVFVEQGLEKKGLRALHKLPLDVLQPALQQLEGLVTNWSPVGLANLRSKMAVAIIDREHMDPDAEADAYRTAAVLDHAPAQSRRESELPEVSEMGALDELPPQGESEQDVLAAAYAALGTFAPSNFHTLVETQGELGSSSSKALSREAQRPAAPQRAAGASDIQLRELQS